MDVAIAFFVGIFIGSAAGIFTFALLAAAKMEDEMIEFLKGMEKREKILQEEKVILRSSVETLEEAIARNNFTGLRTPDMCCMGS